MHWPQITFLILMTIVGTAMLFSHGQTVKVNFFTWLLVTMPVTLTLLYFGGFFG